MRWMHLNDQKKVSSSAVDWRSRNSVPDPADHLTVKSRLLGQRPRTPDGRKCRADNVERRADGAWQSGDDVEWRGRWPVYNNPPSTAETGHEYIGRPWSRSCNWHGQDCPASGAEHAWDASGHHHHHHHHHRCGCPRCVIVRIGWDRDQDTDFFSLSGFIRQINRIDFLDFRCITGSF